MKRIVLPLLIMNYAWGTPTWVGTTPSMNTASNWNPSGVPPQGSVLIFPSGGGLPVTNDIGGFNIGNLTVNDAYTFTGNTFNVVDSTLLTFGSSGANIDLPISTAGATLWNITSTAGGNQIAGAISGGGGLSLAAGLLTLSGVNAYTGPNTVSGGVSGTPVTLQAGSTSAFGNASPANNITLGAYTALNLNGFSNTVGGLSGQPNSSVVLGSNTLTVNQGGAYPFYGIISGTGGITAASGGTVSLMGGSVAGGSNTYVGPTTIQAGTTLNTTNLGATTSLVISNAGKLVLGSSVTSSVPISISGGAAIGSNFYDVTFNGGITGSGPFTYQGPGSLTLTGNIGGITGQILITGGVLNLSSLPAVPEILFDLIGGTLQIGTGLTSIPVPIVMNYPATIDTNGNNCAISGPIEGGQNFTKTGAGTLTLTGGNTYSGLTIVQEGTLNVQPQAIPSTSLQLVFSGNFGTGVFQAGADLTSPTLFTNGVILFTSGTIDTNGHSITLPGALAGASTATLTKAGAGVLTLNGTNLFTGHLVVTGGSVAGNLGSGMEAMLTVGSGGHAAFGSTGGTIGTLTNDGTVTTGGTMTTGSYSMGSTGNLILDMGSSSNFGNLASTGPITLGGTLTVDALPGFTFANGKTVTLLTAPSITGAFSNFVFQNFPASFVPTISYVPDPSVLMTLTQVSPANSTSIAVLGLSAPTTRNQFISRKCFQLRNRINIEPESEKETATSEETNVLEDLQAYNDTIAQVSQKQEQLTQKIVRTCTSSSRPGSAYIGPTSSFGRVKTQGSRPGFGYYSVGALAGADYVLPNDKICRPCNLGLGAIVDYKMISGHNQFTSQALHGGVYSTLVPKACPDLALDGIIGFQYEWNTLRRTTGVMNELTAVGKNRDIAVDAFLDMEYTFSDRTYAFMPKNLYIVPLISLQYVNDQLGGYTETGANTFDLTVKPKTFQSLNTVLGTRIDYLYTAHNFTLLSEFDAGWEREYLNHNQGLSFTTANIPNAFTNETIIGGPRNSLLLALDFLATFQDAFQIETTIDYKLNSLFYEFDFYLGFGGNF